MGKFLVTPLFTLALWFTETQHSMPKSSSIKRSVSISEADMEIPEKVGEVAVVMKFPCLLAFTGLESREGGAKRSHLLCDIWMRCRVLQRCGCQTLTTNCAVGELQH